MTRRTILASIIILGLASPAMAEDGLVEFFPLYKDVVANNPGTEMVHPLLRITDANSDGVPEVNVRFNVYPVNGGTPLFGSSPRSIVFPASPCDPATSSSAEYSLGNMKFQGDGNLARSHLALSLRTGCEDASGQKAAYTTFVYSASINVPSGDPGATIWTRTYPLNLYGFDPDYLNTEGLYILIVSLGDDASPTAPRTGTGNLRSVGLGVLDGVVIFDATRPLKR